MDFMPNPLTDAAKTHHSGTHWGFMDWFANVAHVLAALDPVLSRCHLTSLI